MCLKFPVEGGGKCERECMKWLNNGGGNNSKLSSIFQSACTLIENNCSFGNDELAPVDALRPKTEAWRMAIDLACTTASTDCLIQVGDQQNISKIKQYDYTLVGNL